MPIDESPVAFNRAGAKRVVQATKVVENQYRNDVPGGRYSGGGGGRGLVVAKTDVSGLSALSGTTAGSGNVTLYNMNASGSLTATGVTLKCWNLGAAVAGNKFILVAFGTRGPWAVVEPC